MFRILLTLVILLPGYLPANSLGKPSQKNVLFIALDDLNDWVGFLGGYPGKVHSPNLDRLATRSTIFTNAHCTAPVCCPSRASVLSGLLPTSTGIYNNQHWWKPNWPNLRTIPVHFRENGYHVIGSGKIYHHTAGNNPPSEWDEFQRNFFNDNGWIRHGSPLYPWTAAKARPPEFPYSGIKLYSGEADWGVLPIAEDKYDDTLVAEYAVNYLSTLPEQGAGRPFFLACGLFHPHLPWYVPQNYLDLYPLEDIFVPEDLPSDLEDIPQPGRALAKRKGGDLSRLRKTGKWRSAIRHYLASISFADALVGRILTALQNSEANRNTIIVLWSDHGWHLGEKGHWHKRTLWEEATRIPFLISAPGTGKPGQHCTEAVSLVDLFPTLIDLCNLSPLENLDGISLLPWLHDPTKPRKQPAITIEESGHVAIRTSRYRAIHYTSGEWELYDHQNDPREHTNLANQPSSRHLLGEIRKWIPSSPATPAMSKKAFRFDHKSFTWTHKKSGRVIKGK